MFDLRVDAILSDASGTTVYDSTSRVDVTNATGGELTIHPEAGDFLAQGSPYRLRFRLTAPGGEQQVAFVGSANAGLIRVHPV